MLSQGCSQKDIEESIGKHHTAIYRELKRNWYNRTGNYSHRFAILENIFSLCVVFGYSNGIDLLWDDLLFWTRKAQKLINIIKIRCRFTLAVKKWKVNFTYSHYILTAKGNNTSIKSGYEKELTIMWLDLLIAKFWNPAKKPVKEPEEVKNLFYNRRTFKRSTLLQQC